MRRFLFSQLAFLLTTGAWASAQEVTLRVGSETYTAGGFAQIKVFADSPARIGGGILALDLDPQVFGPVTGIAVYSASGDAAAIASVLGTHLEVTLGAPSGGIGQLPGVPILVVRAPVLSNAASSGYIGLSLPEGPSYFPMSGPYYANYPQDAWTDPTGRSLKVTLVSGRALIFGDAPSIASITPGTGLLPIGTQLEIKGSGFTPSQRLTADGLPLTDVQIVGPARITAKMGAARELTGVAFHLAHGPMQQIDFFTSPESAVPGLDLQPDISPRKTHVVLPLFEQRTARLTPRGYSGAYWAVMLNASASPIDVLVREDGYSDPVSGRTITIAPGQIATTRDPGALGQTYLSSPSPLRIASIYYSYLFGFESVPPTNDSPRALEVFTSPLNIDAAYQTGTEAPPPRTARVGYRSRVQDVALEVNAGPWLKVVTSDTASYKELTLTFEPAGLAPGSYRGVITITPRVPSNLQGFPVKSSTLSVNLTVSNQPSVQVKLTFPSSNTDRISPSSLEVTSNGLPAAFKVRTASDVSGNWFSPDIASGTTPARVNLTADPAKLPNGSYYGKVFIDGPINTVEENVYMQVGPQIPPTQPLQVNPPSTSFVRDIGLLYPPSAGFVNFSPVPGAFTYTVRTEDGGNWLQVDPPPGAGVPISRYIVFRVNPSGLAPGTYRATITGTAQTGTAQATITLQINATPTSPPSATPLFLKFTTVAGMESPAQTVTVTTAQPSFLSIAPGPQLRFTQDPPPAGPNTSAPGKFTFAAYSEYPGHFEGTVRASTQAGSVSIPYTIDVTARPEQPPVIATVLNAASHRPTALSPGEIITIHGFGIGPATTPITLDAQGRVRSDVNTNSRVTINGVAAPIVYASPNQWNVVAPYEVEGSITADLQVFANGIASGKWTLPVAASAPAIFTQTSTGVGQAAVLNQNNTLNSPSNRAAGGTVVQIYATGAGQVVPAAATGSVAAVAGSTRLPVKVLLGSIEAPVTYAGPAPGFVAGVLQINALIPSRALLAGDLPLQLQIDDAASPPATISVGQ